MISKRKSLIFATLISLSLIVLLATANAKFVYADEGASCTECGQQQVPSGISLPSDALTLRYSYNLHGSYVANGTGMRNFGYGTITIQGVPVGSVVVKALLYWNILNATATPNMERGIFQDIPITGWVPVGISDNPCWGGVATSVVYRADVTAYIRQTINGAYSLKGFASGRTDGSDPWVTSTIPPLNEGASLVIIYCNPNLPGRTIQVYDGAVTTPFPAATAQTTLSGFVASASPNAITTFIVADGQSASDVGTWNGNTVVNNFLGNDVVDSTGKRGYFSLGGLWDTITIPVTVLPGDTSATAAIKGGPDCLVWSAQVFQVDTDAYVGTCPSPVGGELTAPSFPATTIMFVMALAAVSVIILVLKIPKKVIKAY